MSDGAQPPLRASIQVRLGGENGIALVTGELDRLLERLSPAGNQPDRADALVTLLRWTFGGPERDLTVLQPLDTSGWKVDPTDIDRLHLLVARLGADEAKRTRLREAMIATLSGCEARGLFGEFGMPSDRGFIAEGSERLLNRVLPRPRDDRDLADLLHRWLGDERVAARVQRCSPDDFARLMEVLCPPAAIADWNFLAQDFADGMRLLMLRVAAQGLSRKLRLRQPSEPVAKSPFRLLPLVGERMIEAWQAGDPLEHPVAEWHAVAAECRARVALIRSHIEAQGVSVDIVYGIEIIQRGLTRVENMVEWIAAPRGAARWGMMRRMLVRSAGFIHQDRSVLALAYANLNLLHCKIVERAGGTGEHYIAHDAAGYGHIWLSSLGGGLLTTFTAAGKVALAGLHATGLVIGIGYGLNYAASFVAMQHLGFMLATKQPAMTAATLATSLRDSSDEQRIERLTTTALGIISSQIAATIANLAAVVLGCVAFDRLWRACTGHSYMTVAKAEALLVDLSPVDSLTVFYAALTGVILWSSSLIGGWLDNWSAYHRLPQGIADHPLGNRFGRERMVALGRFVRRHMAGWGTNISLGMMLGLVPEIGRFLGLPLDVRHVTLNSGMLALACATEGVDWWSRQALFLAIAGIGSMFVLNLGVSFTLSLWTAVRAQGLAGSLILTLYGRVLRTLLRRPWRVLVPRFRAHAPAMPPL